MYKGTVDKLYVREGPSKRGPWKAVSFKLLGHFQGTFFKAGFLDKGESVPVKEGDYITFEGTPDGDAVNVDRKTIKVGEAPADAPAPAPVAKAKPQTGNQKASEMFGTIGGYNTEDDIRRISMTSASSRAIELVGVLLENDCLPLSAANSKAAKGKRYDEAMAYVDKLTVRLFNDSISTRLLDNVQDEGEVDVKAEGELPDDAANDEEVDWDE